MDAERAEAGEEEDLALDEQDGRLLRCPFLEGEGEGPGGVQGRGGEVHFPRRVDGAVEARVVVDFEVGAWHGLLVLLRNGILCPCCPERLHGLVNGRDLMRSKVVQQMEVGDSPNH